MSMSEANSNRRGGSIEMRKVLFCALKSLSFILWSEVTQSCPTLRNPMDCSLPHSSVHGIFQARILEWVAISFSSAWKWKVKMKSLSRVQLFATPWTAAYQAPLSMGFFRQEYWCGVPLPSPKIDWQVPVKLIHAQNCPNYKSWS